MIDDLTWTAARCLKCGATAISTHLVLHHFICAYVGPDFDFDKQDDTLICPKCCRPLTSKGRDWEILGDSYYCHSCGHEAMMKK